MDILLLDNYDSFTYNLAQYIGEVDETPTVARNDEISVQEVRDQAPEAIVISPGPGTPSDAGVSNELIQELDDEIPILGVCLGHQCIADVYGGNIIRADRLLHGKTSSVFHDGGRLYEGLPNPVEATRYHSLLVEENSLPEELTVDALSEQEEIMGIHHVEKPLLGVQFHPESILTEAGRTLISNFLNYAKDPSALGESQRPTVSSQDEDKTCVND